MKNWVLTILSLVFYAWGEPICVLLLIVQALVGYAGGLIVQEARNQAKKLALGVTATVILSMLAVFKYTDFFLANFNLITGMNVPLPGLALPIGISFFTFQTLSYVIDVYRGDAKVQKDPLNVALYIALFPQLVAGPIVRYSDLEAQLLAHARPTWEQMRRGLRRFCVGLGKKVMLADALGRFWGQMNGDLTAAGALGAWMGLLAFSFQIYFDFSGYSDMALGLGEALGFLMPENFNHPYRALSLTDFWRRWHISLSRWLRDYLYIPLGGNRSAGWFSYALLATMLAIATFRLRSTLFTVAVLLIASAIALRWLFDRRHRHDMGTNVNNMDTMLLGGLWHGASFNFITWGGLNGLGILVYKWWKRQGWTVHIAVLAVVTILLWALKNPLRSPLVNLLSFASLVCLIGYTLLHLLPQATRSTHSAWTAWSTSITFIFISFTRLFFRSGSNLDPAEANEVAWSTASQMVHQIGSHWNLAQIPDIIDHYWMPFLLFALGMLIHWLPDRFKRRYRLAFASQPLCLMALTVVAVVLILYQFITADLQPFIYFQF